MPQGNEYEEGTLSRRISHLMQDNDVSFNLLELGYLGEIGSKWGNISKDYAVVVKITEYCKCYCRIGKNILQFSGSKIFVICLRMYLLKLMYVHREITRFPGNLNKFLHTVLIVILKNPRFG